MRSFRTTSVTFLVLCALALAAVLPADARTRRRRAPRTPPRPSGILQVVVLDPDGVVLPAYRTVRVVDEYGGKWESRIDSTGVVTFKGVPPGRAIASCWTPGGEARSTPPDTVWIAVGRTTEATLRFAPDAASPPSGDLQIVVMMRNDSEADRTFPLPHAFVRLLDSAGTRHEGFTGDDGAVALAGLAPGRAIRRAWIQGALPDHGDDPLGTDTLFVVPGVSVDTMHVVHHRGAGEGLFR